MNLFKIFYKSVSMVVLVAFIVSQSGCSIVAGSHTTLTATSMPDDAEIFINGQFVGKGSGSLQVAKNETATIMAKKEGYFPATRTVNKKISTTGILDIIGGFIILVPFLGFLSAGAWDLETHTVNVVLAEK